MSFLITIIKRPRLKSAMEQVKAEGFIDIPELGVMVGEHGGITGIGEFIWDPAWVCEECSEFDGALNDRIHGKPREMLIDCIKLGLPKGWIQN